MAKGGPFGLLFAIVLFFLFVLPTAPAAPADGAEIVDPEGDAVHREFGWEEPTLDVTQVSFNWTADARLEVAVLLPQADVLGPEGTTDPAAPGHQETYVDVYWSMDGEGYVARAKWDADGEASFLAGQGMRIHRQVFWEMGDDIHGDVTEQDGRIEPVGSGHLVVILVDPAAVGSPGPGSLLEAPAFSSYIDHHMPVGDAWPLPHPFGPHHPANADVNDRPGWHYHIPENASADPADMSAGDRENTPMLGILWVAVAGLAVAARRR